MAEPQKGKSGEKRPLWVSPGVAGVGAASFLSDAGHEIATAALPGFLVGVLGGSAATLGAIEGFSDAVLGAAKLFAGPLANHPGRRARIAEGGYLLTAFFTSAIGLVGAIWQAGVLRAAAWVARGIRGPSRDAMLASIAPDDARGRAFGFERAGDNLGAVVGPLLAAALVPMIGVRWSFAAALVPGALAAVAIGLAAREQRGRAQKPESGAAELRQAEDASLSAPPAATPHAQLDLAGLRRGGLARPLVPIAMFEIANVAPTLLLLRTTQLLQSGGRSAAAATSLGILLYAAHNAAGSVLALVGGRWIDRSGARRVFTTGAGLYVVSYAGFALPISSWPTLLLLFSLAGGGIGLAETAESTLVAELVPDHLHGSGFGVLGAVQSAGDLLASVVVGGLYAAVSPAVGFGYAAAWMALAVVAAAAIRRRSR